LHNSTLKYGISYRPLDQRDNVGIFGGQNRRKSRKSENGKKRIRTPLDPVTRPDRRRNRTRGCGLRSPSAIINSGARPLESQSNLVQTLAAPLQPPDLWRRWSLLKAVANLPPPSLGSAGGDPKGGGTRDELLPLRRVQLRERLRPLRRSRPQPRWPEHLLRLRCHFFRSRSTTCHFIWVVLMLIRC